MTGIGQHPAKFGIRLAVRVKAGTCQGWVGRVMRVAPVDGEYAYYLRFPGGAGAEAYCGPFSEDELEAA